MKSVVLSAFASILLLVSGPALAQSEPPPLEAYGRLPAFDLVEISPSGDRLAFASVADETRTLLLAEIGDGADRDSPLPVRLIGRIQAGDAKVRSLHWLGENSILTVASITGRLTHFSSFRGEFGIGQIYNLPANELNVVFGRNRDVSVAMGAVTIRNFEGEPTLFTEGWVTDRNNQVDLFRIDSGSGRGVAVERGDFDVRRYVLDAQAAPIARSRYNERRRRWDLQYKQQGQWRTVWSTDAPVDAPWLAGLGRTADTVAVVAQLETDVEPRLYEVDSQGAFTGLFDQAPGRLLRHPETHLLIGFGHGEGDTFGYTFFDEVAAHAWSSITRAYPDQTTSLEGWSADMSKAVIFTEGPTDPGTFHLVDLGVGRADVIGEAYPDIGPEQVAEVRPISYPAGDGMTIPGYLTLPPGREARDLPLVVLPHGGPASRDYMGFDWWAQALASRGYAVLQPNFRGSDGLGQAHMEAGYGEWGRKMQTDLSDGVRYLAEQGLIDPERACIVGASYGGYAALAGVTLERGIYRCAVSVAGVSDLRRMVLWAADRDVVRDNSTVRYWNRFMGADGVGDRSLNDRSPALRAAEADAPILLLHGLDDTVVPFEQSRAMASALDRAGRPYQLIELEGEDHWLSMNETRQRMLTETVRFLETHNPAD
jgi:dipeptidyl aminopeptidase/acylaminoacyl peptidase